MKGFKKIILITTIILITIFTMACSSQEEVSTKVKGGSQINKSLSMKLTLEKGVIAGQVFVKGNIATAKIVADNQLEKSKLEEIADNYVGILRECYGDKCISIQGIQNNETIVDLFIEQ